MDSRVIATGIIRAIAILAGIALLLFLVYKIKVVLIYITIAAVISLIGRPLVFFLRNRLKFTNTFAVIVTMVIMVTLLLGLISMFIPLVIKQGQNLSLLNVEALQENIEGLYREVSDYFAINQIDIEQTIKDSGILSGLNFAAIPNFLNAVANFLGDFSVGLFSVVFISFFFLKDSRLFEDGVMVFVPNDKERRLKKSFDKMKDLLSRYFIGLLLQILILFILYTIILLIFGIDNAIVIAFLCALLNLVPYIGPIISGLLMLFLTMTSNLGQDFSSVILPKTIYVFIGFIIAQLVDNLFSQPYIFSNSVRSHPLEIFLVIIIGGLLFGITGMVIAVPGYTVIKVILKEFLAENKVVKSLTKNL
ncbi:AI-2E family transporter [Leptobacterium sp. I13]|uniref:AI-2E family transporter n=1 Tax=Leptobacterium meishanense TaxID=3128904 RepID=UPI0030EC40B2